MIDDPELNGVNNYKITKQHRSSIASTTGIWIQASYINHSCNSTCERSFIGDFQIVKAARDMPANTELTFSYITMEEPAAMNKKLSEGWGFKCNCALCVDDRATPSSTKAQRRKLINGFSRPNTSILKKEEVIEQLEGTYMQPSSKVPRLEM